MIIGTYSNHLSVGNKTICPRFTDDKGNNHYNVPMVIMEEVTKEDYITYCKETNTKVYDQIDWDKAKFYRISVD